MLGYYNKTRIMGEISVPVRFNMGGNAPEAEWTVKEVLEKWKTSHCYEVVFRSEDEEVMVFGDIDKSNVHTDEFDMLDANYRTAIKTYLGDREYALATASSKAAGKISWRFYLPAEKGVRSAQESLANNINTNQLIKLSDGSAVSLDVSVYSPSRKMRMLHAWKQTKVDGKLVHDKKRWENRPLKLVSGSAEDTILHNVRDSAVSLPIPAVRSSVKPVSASLSFDDFKTFRDVVMKVLPESEASDYESWRNVIWAIKGTDETERGLELAHDFSKRDMSKYDEDEVNRVWEQGNGSRKAGSIHYRAKACNPVAYAQVMQSISIEFLETELKNGDIGKARIFAEHFKDVLVSVPSATKRTYFLFDHSTGLWTEVYDDAIITRFTAQMKTILKPLAVTLAANAAQCADSSEGKDMRKSIKDLLVVIESTTKTKTARDCLPQIYTSILKDKDWASKTFNQKRDILPVANGVLDLRTGELRAYEREDYLTYKLAVKYNPDADTSKQNKFFGDVLQGKTDDIDFIRYYLGYCLTGEVSMQKILVLEGSLDGANGKSVLLSCMSSVLGQFYATMQRKVLCESKDKCVNNDSLYDAEFSRVACISELNKNADIDEGLLKNITGDETYRVAAKYKNEKTFVPQWKIIMPLNAMFSVPADSGAVWRRFIIMPFVTRFLSRDHVDWNDEDAAIGRIVVKDEPFVNSLKADTEGWLAWLVQGAKAYYASPMREPPPSLQKHLETKQTENDAHRRFIEERYVITSKSEHTIDKAHLVRDFRGVHEGEMQREHERRLQNETKEATEKRLAAAMKKLKVSDKQISVGGSKARCWIGLRERTLEDDENGF